MRPREDEDRLEKREKEKGNVLAEAFYSSTSNQISFRSEASPSIVTMAISYEKGHAPPQHTSDRGLSHPSFFCASLSLSHTQREILSCSRTVLPSPGDA